MAKQRSWICRNWFWLVWAAVALGLLWRVRFCTAGEEESYFLTQAYSYLQGMIPMAEIWGGTLFSSMIFMPLAALFQAVSGGWAGIYLFLRVCYVLFECLVSAAAFLLLGRFASRNWAGFGALLVLVFTPLNLNTFSYNSLGMHFTLLFVLLALFGARQGHWWANVLAGCCFALALEAYPPMVVLLPICFLLLAQYPAGRRLLSFGQFCLGGAAAFAVFLVELLVRAPLSVYLESVGNLLIADSAHQSSGGIVAEIISWLASCRWWYGTAIILACGVLWLLCGAARFATCHGKKLPRAVWTVLAILTVAVAVWGLVMLPRGEKFYSNMKWFIPGLLWPAVLCLCWPKDKLPGITLCVAGMLYASGVFYGSDLGVVNGSYGFLFCVLGEVLWLSQALEMVQIQHAGKTLCRVLAVVLALLLPVQLGYMRFFYDSFGNPSRCNVRLSDGIMTGLWVEPEKAEAYEGVLRDVAANVPAGSKLLVLDILPYAYMLDNYVVCAPTPWINNVGDEQNRIFYEKNPHLVPEYVFVAQEKTGFSNRADTSAESLPDGYIKQMLLQPGVQRTETESGTFYKLPESGS